MSKNFFDDLFSNSKPEATFAITENETLWTYRALYALSGRFANVLYSRGLRTDDRIAVQVPKSIEAIALYLACLRLGAIFIPLNTAYTSAEIDYFLSNSKASFFVCDPKAKKSLDSVAQKNLVQLETLGDQKNGSLTKQIISTSSEFKNVGRLMGDIVAILYTSGTTGRSKGAMLTYENLLSNALTLVELWKFSSDDVLFHALPIFHTHGLFVATNVVMLSSASMLFVPGFSVDQAIRCLPRCSVMMGVPTYYTRLLNDSRLTATLVSHMRVFISGSAPLLREAFLQFEQRTGHHILERYGMTETNMITSNPYEADRKPESVGFPLPHVDIRICEIETGKNVEKGEIGVVEVKGPNVFKGYWEMPEKTAEEFRSDGFFVTGDLGFIDEEDYVHIVGRCKDLIISGGYNIYPKEIELLLDGVDGVSESAVIGVPHPDLGEAVVGVIVVSNDQLRKDTLMSEIRAKIASFKLPKKLIFVPALPRNVMGKVQKNVLRQKYATAFTSDWNHL